MIFSQFTTQILDKIVAEIKKEENQEKVQKHILDPIIHYVMKRIYPYLVGICVIFILLILLAIIIIFLILHDIKYKNIKIIPKISHELLS